MNKAYPSSGGVSLGAGKTCGDCHDYSLKHIDGSHRTFDCAGSCDSTVYKNSYRLDTVSGSNPMEIPRTSVSPLVSDSSFSLCFKCHNSVKFTNSGNSQSNFKNPLYGTPNLHYYHLANYNQRWQADWTNGINSRMTCVTCHNVHGSTRLSMVRDGKLINREPGLEIWYDNYNINPPPQNITLIDSTGWNWNRSSFVNLCSGCHGGGMITIDRPVSWSGEMPVLSFTLETNYTVKAVHPVNAGNGEDAVFRVKYTDLQDNPPSIIQLWIDLNDDGDYDDPGEKITMNPVDGDSVYTDGKLYTRTVTINYPSGTTDGNINYRFAASDGTNEATGTPTEDRQLRIDENNAHDVPGEYGTIQAAIDAYDTDGIATVLVADGMYVEKIDFKGKPVTVMSVNGYSATIIDGNAGGSVVSFKTGESSSSILDGFTVRNGTGTISNGGGIYINNASPVIKNCNITGNSIPNYGAGIYMTGSSAIIQNTVFSNNTANLDGVIYAVSSSPAITNCTFNYNTVRYGGGVYVSNSSSTVTITDAVINNNAVTNGGGIYSNNSTLVINGLNIHDNTAGSFGGGLYLTGSSNVTIGGACSINNNTASTQSGGGSYINGSTLNLANCSVSGNYANSQGGGLYLIASSNLTLGEGSIINNNTAFSLNGGGIYISGSSASISRSYITNNLSGDLGGGIFITSASSPINIVNTLISGNSAGNSTYEDGGGVNSQGSTVNMANCTVVYNYASDDGAGIYSNSAAFTIVNTIIYGNTSGNASPYELDGWGTISYSLLLSGKGSAGWTKSDMVTTAPAFVNAGIGNFHLQNGSSGIDAGTGTGAPSDDLDGTSRPQNGLYDIGVYEYVP